MLRWVLLLVCCSLPVPAETLSEAIERAGNVDSDRTRLEILSGLAGRVDLPASLRPEVERLAAEIERWVTDPHLYYWDRPIRAHQDYDFGVAANSPLYSLTRLYRGRMLVWAVLEYGGLFQDPTSRAPYLGKARAEFEAYRRAFPENRIAGMYLGEPIPPKALYPPAPGAPEWAVYQREALERLADVVEWWIDHRMRPTGEFGGGWGDDCEMWRFWVPVLIAFEDPKIAHAQARLSEGLFSQAHMAAGYTNRMSDVEHTAEDSADTLTPMMHLEPDRETWKHRALRLVELMETRWTGVNERGFLQFKSTYFSVDKVDETPERACDTVYHPRTIQPALLYWLRTGDERLGRLVSRWMDAWVDVTARAERGKPAGVIPSAMRWPDGLPGCRGPNWWDPRNHRETTLYEWPSALRAGLLPDTLLLTYAMTGKEKYLEPLKSMAALWRRHADAPAESPEPGSEAWVARNIAWLGSTLAKYQRLTGDSSFDDLLDRSGDPYGRMRRTGELGSLTLALRDTARALRQNFEGYTSEVRYTDRVLRFPALFAEGMMFPRAVPAIQAPDTDLLYSTATGDAGRLGYCPMNAVRWRTPPRDIAALVTQSGRRAFQAELYHFGKKARPIEAELYLLDTGEYTLRLSSSGKGVQQQQFRVEGPRTRIRFTLPPREPATLSVEPL